ncbi:MAG: hypothetical protein IJZ85_12375 [Lachnospiraceae bacterium]|nr:hypothetical protein [Lachnospiraceae bacterium]
MRKLSVAAYVRFMNLKDRLLNEERGGGEIVAAVILVALAVVLGVFFREQIVGIIQGIFDGVDTSTINETIS